MGRSLSLVSVLVVSALSAGCTFSKASQSEIFKDGSAPLDLNLPDLTGTDSGGFMSDAHVTCVDANPQTMNVPPDILMVFDRSGSMNDDLNDVPCAGGCGLTSKWSVATTTIEAFLPMAENLVNWGLKLFATGNACQVTNMVEVAPAAMNAAAITARLGTTMPGSQTPTTNAMLAAATYLSTLNDGNQKFILLATDGIPTCGNSACAPGVNGGNNQCDDAKAIAAVKTVHDMGIPTFVLGIGTANSPGDATLSQMAVNGGFPRNDTPSYYPIGNANDLTTAFMNITQMVGQCFFSVRPALTAGQKIAGVAIDGGGSIPADPANGYTAVGQNGVQLNGQACSDFMSGKITGVKVLVDCNG
jgi:hypothetical protein